MTRSEIQSQVSLFADESADPIRLQLLERRLGLRTTTVSENAFSSPYTLYLGSQQLELRSNGKGAPGPIMVDFVFGRMAHRRRYGGGRGQPLARAVGLKHGKSPRVLDATPGMGRDAFVLASLGCDVMMIERSPVIHALLEDGLLRAESDSETQAVTQRMHLRFGDSTELLHEMTDEDHPEVIYLDPMYPHRKKSALVKKEMRLFRDMVGDDEDATELLRLAIQHAAKRVVVKRPIRAEPLDGLSPDVSIKSVNTRYDIYLASDNER